MHNENDQNIETLSSVISRAFEGMIKDVHTSFPCIIESFDPKLQTASMNPVIKRIFVDVNTKEKTVVDLPKLINVPILFPKGGGFSLTFPIKVGDECIVFISERSIDDWYESGKSTEQLQKRFHDLSDGMAFVGLSSKPNALADYDEERVQLRSNDGLTSISITSDNKIQLLGNVEINGNMTVTGDTVFNGDTDTQGNISSTGTVDNNEINIGSNHFHTQANDSDGNTEQPTGGPQ